MKILAFSISIIGILILLIFLNIYEPSNMEIMEINDNYLGKQVKVSGKVYSIKYFDNNFTIFTIINDTNKINVICTCPKVKKEQNLELIGRINKYEKSLQIQADKIKWIKN